MDKLAESRNVKQVPRDIIEEVFGSFGVDGLKSAHKSENSDKMYEELLTEDEYTILMVKVRFSF